MKKEDAENRHPESFRVVHDHSFILDYVRTFSESVAVMPKSKTLKIKLYQRFYFLNGVFSTSRTVNWHISEAFEIMSRRNVHSNEVHPEVPSVQKSKVRDIWDLVDYFTYEDFAAYLREICTPFNINHFPHVQHSFYSIYTT